MPPLSHNHLAAPDDREVATGGASPWRRRALRPAVHGNNLANQAQNSSNSNGLSRTAAAPSRLASARVAGSPKAVMRMTGVSRSCLRSSVRKRNPRHFRHPNVGHHQVHSGLALVRHRERHGVNQLSTVLGLDDVVAFPAEPTRQNSPHFGVILTQRDARWPSRVRPPYLFERMGIWRILYSPGLAPTITIPQGHPEPLSRKQPPTAASAHAFECGEPHLAERPPRPKTSVRYACAFELTCPTGTEGCRHLCTRRASAGTRASSSLTTTAIRPRAIARVFPAERAEAWCPACTKRGQCAGLARVAFRRARRYAPHGGPGSTMAVVGRQTRRRQRWVPLPVGRPVRFEFAIQGPPIEAEDLRRESLVPPNGFQHAHDVPSLDFHE